MVIVGVDPGISGALALYQINKNHTKMSVYDMPIKQVMSGKKSKNAVDFTELANMLETWTNIINKDYLSMVCEKVHPMPFNGSIGSFKLGEAFGGIQGLAAAFDIPLTLVSPQAWKAHYCLLRTEKSESIKVASKLFPDLDLSKKKYHNRAEAALIAHYGLYAAGRILK